MGVVRDTNKPPIAKCYQQHESRRRLISDHTHTHRMRRKKHNKSAEQRKGKKNIPYLVQAYIRIMREALRILHPPRPPHPPKTWGARSGGCGFTKRKQ